MLWWLYCSMPGQKRTKIALTASIVIGVIGLIFFFVFPSLSHLVEPDTIVYRN